MITLAINVKSNETMVIYKHQMSSCDLLSKVDHLDCHIPIFLNTSFSEITVFFEGVFIRSF